MARARTIPARLGRVFLAVVTVAASTLLVAAGPAHAITTPAAGQPCGQDDLGRRAPKVASATADRVVTFLQCHRVTQTNGTQQLQWVNHGQAGTLGGAMRFK